MAKKIDTSNLSVDYKQLMRMTVQDRVGLAKSGLGEELMQSLTPTQLALAFPKYYSRQLPDIGRVITGGGAAPTYGGTAPSYGGGRPSQTAAPVPSTPSGRQNPQSSSAAKENQQNDFINEIRRQVREKQGINSSGLVGGAKLPSGVDSESIKALNEVASKFGLKPESISMMIDLESKWNTKTGTGSYRGLTQIGPTTFREAKNGRLGGLTWDEYKNASPAQQIRAYGDWLEHYKFNQQLQKHNINLSSMPPHMQAAYLQGMQFAPNAQKWKEEFARGNYNYRTTETSQARALGSTSIADMSRYYANIEKTNPAQYQKDATGIIPQDQSKSQQASSKEGLREGLTSKANDKEYLQSIYERGAKIGGIKDYDSFKRQCGKGTRGLAGALLNDSYFNKGLGETGSSSAGSLAVNNDYLSKSGFYNNRQQINLDQIKSKEYLDSLPIGTVIASHNNGRGDGHVQIKVAPGQWVSDKRQGNKILDSGSGGSFTGFAVFTPNQVGLNKLDPRSANDPATVAWAVQQGYSLSDEQKKIASQNTAVKSELPSQVPSDYSSWPKPLQNYLKRNPDIEKEIFNAHALGVPVLDAFNKAYEKNPKLFEQSSEATADLVKTITNTPPGELPSTILGTDLQGSNVSAKPYERVVTNITGYSPGSYRPKAAGPGKVESTTEELNIIKRGIDNRGPSFGYHAAVASFYHNKETGEKIDETSYNKLPNSQKQNYIEKAEVHQLRNPNKRVASMGGINPTTGKSWNADTYAVVRVGKMSPEKIRAYEDHLAEKLARGEIPELAIRNIYGDGQLRPAERGEHKFGKYRDGTPVEPGGEGVSDAKNINKQRIFERAEKIREQIQQQQAQPQVTVAPPNTQTQQGQAPVPAEAVAAPSPQQLKAQNPTGQQNQGGGVAPPRQGVPPAPQAPQTSPAPQAPQAATTPTAVPLPEPAPEPGKYGGGEITDLRPNEDAYVVQAKTGQVVAQMNSKQEILAGNEVIPTRRIDNIRTEMQNDSRNIQQEQPQQQSNQPVASMTPSTQMPQSQPNMYNDANQIYGGMMGSIYDMPGSMEEAINQTRFFNRDIKMGFNTLKA